jgi:aspartyl protease family protein
MKFAWIFLLLAAIVGLLIWQLDRIFPGRLDHEEARMQIMYSGLLLAAMAPGVLLAFKGRIGQGLRYAVIWIALLGGALVLYAFRDMFEPVITRVHHELNPSAARLNAQGEVIIKRSQDGHFYVDAHVNGQRVYFMVDTGASRVALSFQDARRVGIDVEALRFTIPVGTANGIAMNASIALDSVAIMPLIVENVRASVAKDGQLSQSLLGMSFLEALGGYRVEGDELILWR